MLATSPLKGKHRTFSAVCREIKGFSSDSACYSGIWLWCCTAASTPSRWTLPHAEGWAILYSLTIWPPGALGTHTHQLEKGYLVLLLASCLPGADRVWERIYNWKSWVLWVFYSNSNHFPTTYPRPTQQDHNHKQWLSIFPRYSVWQMPQSWKV